MKIASLTLHHKQSEVKLLADVKKLMKFYTVPKDAQDFYNKVMSGIAEECTKVREILGRTSEELNDRCLLNQSFSKYLWHVQQSTCSCGDDLNLIKIKLIIAVFVGKFILYKQNLSRKEYLQFPHFSKLSEILQEDTV